MGVAETGGSGRRSEDEWDNITHLEQRTRGLRGSFKQPEAGGLRIPPLKAGGHEDDEGSIKPSVQWGYADLVLKPRAIGKDRGDR